MLAIELTDAIDEGFGVVSKHSMHFCKALDGNHHDRPVNLDELNLITLLDFVPAAD